MRINVADLKLQKDSRKKSEFDWISILLILLAIGIVVGAIYFIFYFRESGVEQLLKSEEMLSTIVVVQNGEKTDAISLSFYNPKTEKLAHILIPAKTRLKVDYDDKPAYDSVENMYNRGSMNVVKDTVERVTNTSFPFYLAYDLHDVEKLVDLLEGLEVIVPEPMEYTDAEQDLFINIAKGKQVLDGAKVKQLLQYQYGPSGMKSVVENHRIYVESLLDRADDVDTLLMNQKVLNTLARDLDTNLSRKDILLLAGEMKNLNSSRLLFYKMHGKNITVKDQQYITPVENGIWLRDRIETVKKFISDEGPAPFGDEIKMEILNGSVSPGQAQNLRNYFIEYGFNVVHYGNALRNDYERTMVIDRIGRPGLAKRIADIINCREVYTRIDDTLLVDVTIVIGNDFEGKTVR
jgi:anionic cell wall polymer biosynthesis LytR-Cps2A-Psr (LCP) family protein